MHILDQEFVLSPHYRFVDVNELSLDDFMDDAAAEELKAQTIFVLHHTYKNKDYIVNATIKAFLEAFSTVTSLRLVVRKFAKQVNCAPKEIGPTMFTFFSKMLRYGILVEAASAQEANTDVEDEVVFELGESLEEYIIVDEIDIHGAVEVYLAEHMSTKEQVVIKILNCSVHASERYIQRKQRNFRHEFKLMAQIQHYNNPNICQLIKFVDAEHMYGIMEYIEGEELKKYVVNNRIDFSLRLNLIQQVFDLLACLHQNQMLHGDIHASNFLITPKNIVKLIDFGMSNNAQPDEDEVIRKGGVFQYIPPERLTHDAFKIINKTATYASEVFQLGIIAYYLLYRTMPFKGLTWHSLAQAIQGQEPAYATTTSEQNFIAPVYIGILQKALHKQPEKRYKSAIQLAEAWKKAIQATVSANQVSV